MIDTKIRNKIRQIKIYTKRMMQSSISGDYLSAFKGSGLEFDQLREYQFGDDVRFIDWNSSAKMNKIMVKQFIEERDRTVILAIDISASSSFSSQNELRKDTIAQVAAALAFVAHENKDKVGILFFSDRIEKWIPPSRGNLHVGKIVETLFSFKPEGKKTDLVQALRFLVNLKKRNSILFVLSDWIEDDARYAKILKVASVEYDFVGIRLVDPREQLFPDIGFLEIEDPESGKIFALDSRNFKLPHESLNTFLAARLNKQKNMFHKYDIDLLDLTLGHAFINPLIMFFHQRTRRQV